MTFEPPLHLLPLLQPYKINGLTCYSFAIAAATVPPTRAEMPWDRSPPRRGMLGAER